MKRYKEVVPELLGSSLERGNSARLRVTRDSMSPFLNPGDYLRIKKTNEESLRIGDLLLFSRGADLVVHRYLLSINRGGRRVLVTKGDNRFFFDRPRHGDALLGKVMAVERGERLREMERGLWGILNPVLGALSLVEGAFFLLGRGVFLTRRKMPDARVLSDDR